MRLLSLILITCMAAVVLSACGQKGPLYLPKPEQTESKAMRFK